MSATAKRAAFMTVEDFLSWSPPDGRVWQLVDGEPHPIAPANATHGRLQAELSRLIGNFLVNRDLPCDVFTNVGVVPATMSRHNMRVPDLLVSCSPYDAKQAAPSDPVLIIEILSPGNRAETWANVWAYTTIPSVQEILVLNADAIGGALLRRLSDKSWPDQAVTLDRELALSSIGFQVSLASLYERTPLKN